MKKFGIVATIVVLGAIGYAVYKKTKDKKPTDNNNDNTENLVTFIYDGKSTDFPEVPFRMIVADSVTSIGEHAFENRTLLLSVNIPAD
jgi:hypothetical protein